MEIHQLRYFVAVADEGSFSRAAIREHVAQPSLSQQIQKLEAEMDQRLFDRLPRSVVLTEAGKCLLDYARKILVEIGSSQAEQVAEIFAKAGLTLDRDGAIRRDLAGRARLVMAGA